MKVYLIIILLLMPLFMTAQSPDVPVQRVFFDCELGVSSYKDVVNNCTRRGFKPEYGDGTVTLYDAYYGQFKWGMIVFGFSSGNVLSYFSLFDNDYYYNFRSWHGIVRQLVAKYGQHPYYFDKSSPIFLWDDGITNLYVSLNESLLIIYSDDDIGKDAF